MSGKKAWSSRSMSIDQSMSVWASHCLCLPFSYSVSSRSRGSSYSQLKTVSLVPSTNHCVVSTGSA